VEFIIKGFPHISCKVDWMTDSRTSQCPLYVSDRPQLAPSLAPGATQVGIDIFAQAASLPEWSPGWLNPPWHLIPRVLNLVLKCLEASAIVVFPTMECKHWWPQFLLAVHGRKWMMPRQRVHYVNLEGIEVPGRHSLTLAKAK